MINIFHIHYFSKGKTTSNLLYIPSFKKNISGPQCPRYNSNHSFQSPNCCYFRKTNNRSTNSPLIRYSHTVYCIMMTLSKGNIFRVTGPLCGEFTGHRWISHKQGQWRRALRFSLIYAWLNAWVNNRAAGDLRHHCAHYDVIVMMKHTDTFVLLFICYACIMSS